MSEEEKEAPITETPIVIIDDDSSMTDVARSALERSGKFTNITTHDGTDGLIENWISSGKMPGLIICDVMMPGQNGPEFIEELWEACRETGKNFPKIIFMSGLQSKAARQQMNALSEKVGEIRFIQKPFTPREIVNPVKETLREK